MAPGLPKISLRRCPHPVADGDADMLHDRIVAIAIDHARGAAVVHALGPVEFPYVAERAVPIMAAPKLQVPIKIKAFPSRQAREAFRLAARRWRCMSLIDAIGFCTGNSRLSALIASKAASSSWAVKSTRVEWAQAR